MSTLMFFLQVIFMTNFLEANHFKMASFLADLDKTNKPAHKFAKYIEQTRDKQVNMGYLLQCLDNIHPAICKLNHPHLEVWIVN